MGQPATEHADHRTALVIVLVFDRKAQSAASGTPRPSPHRPPSRPAAVR
jgi:hypothetical protein